MTVKCNSWVAQQDRTELEKGKLEVLTQDGHVAQLYAPLFYRKKGQVHIFCIG